MPRKVKTTPKKIDEESHLHVTLDLASDMRRLNRDPRPDEYAGFLVRLAAGLLDLCIFIIPFTLVLFATNEWLAALLLLAAFSYLDGQGGTPGKHVLGLRVIDEENYDPGPIGGLIRNASMAFSLLLCGIGFFMVAWDEKRQGLHDKVAKTYVVKAREN